MKITTTDLKKLIREQAYKLLELDFIDDVNKSEETPQDTLGTEPVSDTTSLPLANTDAPQEEKVVDYSNISSSVKRISGKMTPEQLTELIDEINNILDTGKGKRTHENSIKTKANEIEYITSVLGALYKTVSPGEKTNIRNYMFAAFNPYIPGKEKTSTLSRMVARGAGIEADLRFNDSVDADYYTGIVAESIYDAIDYCLENYNPEKTSFGRFLWMVASGRASAKIKSKRYKTSFGNTKTSIDNPINSIEDGEGETMAGQLTEPETGFTPEQKEGVKALAHALSSFIKEKLSAPKHANYLEFYHLFAEEGMSLPEISDITGKEMNNLRVIKKRLEDFISAYVENGELQKFIKEKVGLKVNFPNNKFSLSAKNEKNTEPEPVFIWKQDLKSNNPEAGEWIEITPDKAEVETSWFDKYGDIAFDSSDEEKGEEEGILNPDTTDTNGVENIREVREVIKKIFSI